MDSSDREKLSDIFFRRAFIPITLSILILLAVFVIISVPMDTPSRWPTFPIASQKIFSGGYRVTK
jgi:hypothetical protein